MTLEATLLSTPANFAVVRLETRKFPGVLVQGDTLHNMHKQVERMRKLLSAGELGDLEGEIADLRDLLASALNHFERVCADRGIDLPY